MPCLRQASIGQLWTEMSELHSEIGQLVGSDHVMEQIHVAQIRGRHRSARRRNEGMLAPDEYYRVKYPMRAEFLGKLTS